MRRLLVLLVVISLFTYLPFLRNQLLWDDEQFIYNNVYVKNFDIAKIFTTNTIAGAGESSNYYRPLTTLSFALDYQFWGTNPIGFHLSNTVLHALAALALFILLLTLGLPTTIAFGLSALFAVHPIQTEAVTYANSRGDSFYSLLGLVSLLALCQALRNKSSTCSIYDLRINIPPTVWAGVSTTSYALSILAKEIGIAIFGLQVLLVVQWWLQHRKPLPKMVALTLITSMIIAITCLGLRFSIFRFQPELNLYDPAVYGVYGTNVGMRVLTFSKILWIYFGLLLFPHQLHMERSTTVVSTIISVWPWLSLLLIAALGWLGWRELRARNTTWIWLGTAWFLILLAPVSGILPINGMLYEHWLYLPMVGFFLTLYGVAKLYSARLSYQKHIFTIVIIALMILSWRQNYIWANPIRFYSYTLRFAKSARLHNNLAMAYANDSQLERAVAEYNAAISESDVYPQTHHNLGNAYAALGRAADAEHSYLRAIALNDHFGPSYTALAKLYQKQGRVEDAARVQSQFKSALRD